MPKSGAYSIFFLFGDAIVVQTKDFDLANTHRVRRQMTNPNKLGIFR